MIRCRFFTHEPDYRPIKWPPAHPYWCSGSGEDRDGDYWILITYADDEAQVKEFWPEAFNLDSEERDEYLFTSRFPQPEWFTNPRNVPLKVIP